jgi:hypothetical protein
MGVMARIVLRSCSNSPWIILHRLWAYSPDNKVRALTWQRKETKVSQVNVNQPEPESQSSRGESAGTAATRNLTWAVAAVIVIAAIAVAIVYLVHSLHP